MKVPWQEGAQQVERKVIDSAVGAVGGGQAKENFEDDPVDHNVGERVEHRPSPPKETAPVLRAELPLGEAPKQLT